MLVKLRVKFWLPHLELAVVKNCSVDRELNACESIFMRKNKHKLMNDYNNPESCSEFGIVDICYF